MPIFDGRRSTTPPSISASARRSSRPARTPDTAPPAPASCRWRRRARRWPPARGPSAPRPCDPWRSTRRRADRGPWERARSPSADKCGPSTHAQPPFAGTQPRGRRSRTSPPDCRAEGLRTLAAPAETPTAPSAVSPLRKSRRPGRRMPTFYAPGWTRYNAFRKAIRSAFSCADRAM